MLRSFDFTGNISSICLKNIPLLLKVSLTGYDRKAGDLDFAKVFESCSALEHLLLDFSSDELFNDEGFEAPKRLPFDLNSVKQFYLPDIVMVESYALSFSLCLIRSFPYLEYLEIDVLVYSEEHGGCILESLELKHFSDSTFNHLREVKLVCFAGTTPEMQLIKLLLAKSPVLVRMLIACNLDDEHLDARLRIFAEVSTFLRASPEAEVVYEKFEDHIIFD